MLNYLRAELYKLFRRKYFWGLTAIVLALEGLLVAAYLFINAHGGHAYFNDSVNDVILRMLGVGGVCAVLTGDVVFAAQYRNATLKNEVSFGLPRWRIYLGKLAAQLIASVLLCLVAVGGYVAACRLLLPVWPEGGDLAEVWRMLGRGLLAALPLWVGVQGMVCACFFLIRGEGVALFTALCLFWALPGIMQFVGGLFSGYPMGDLLLKVLPWTPSAMLDATRLHLKAGFYPWLTRTCLVGGVWLAVSTALGLWRFRRKEIH